jgi:hypothetical protein
MRVYGIILCAVLLVTAVAIPTSYAASVCAPQRCVPDRPIPPESVGPMSLPFDVPVWPTLLKTEFHIMPWISMGKASVCIPGTCTAIEFPAPCFSLKPIPIWIPWLRPLDVECSSKNDCSWVP